MNMRPLTDQNDNKSSLEDLGFVGSFLYLPAHCRSADGFPSETNLQKDVLIV